jgi:short-subunit dehydrogenase
MKNILIIGSGKDFGTELICTFLNSGYHVVVVNKSNTNQSIINAKLQYYQLNIVDYKKLGILLKELKLRFQSFEAVIWNLKSNEKGNWQYLDINRLSTDFSINIAAIINFLQKYKTVFGFQINSKFIFTGGGFKDRPSLNQLSLSLSKAALDNLIHNFYLEYENQKVYFRTIIIDAQIKAGTKLDPNIIAKQFLQTVLKPESNYQIYFEP